MMKYMSSILKNTFINFLACGCSAFGSIRQDCEQLTGRCMCVNGVLGAKCDQCSSRHQVLSPAVDGCHTTDVLARSVSAPCNETRCWFGARCLNVENSDGVVVGHRCMCPTDCLFVNKTAFKGRLMDEEVKCTLKFCLLLSVLK